MMVGIRNASGVVREEDIVPSIVGNKAITGCEINAHLPFFF